jgi:hypothetical protein
MLSHSGMLFLGFFQASSEKLLNPVNQLKYMDLVNTDI